MVNYSEQALDRISSILADPKFKIIDVGVENAVLEILANGREFPKSWRKTNFSPANVYQDSFDVLGFMHAGDDWNIRHHKDTDMFEAYVVDKKYSVASFSLSRAIFSSMYNYHMLKNKVPA
jgi:hypothetical protein